MVEEYIETPILIDEATYELICGYLDDEELLFFGIS